MATPMKQAQGQKLVFGISMFNITSPSIGLDYVRCLINDVSSHMMP